MKHCLSLQITAPLIVWNNYSEEVVQNHFDLNRSDLEPPPPSERLKKAGKALVTEVALPFLAVAAIVETVVTATLAALSLVLWPLTDRPLTFSVHWLRSCGDMFTYIPSLFFKLIPMELYYVTFKPQVLSHYHSVQQ